MGERKGLQATRHYTISQIHAGILPVSTLGERFAGSCRSSEQFFFNWGHCVRTAFQMVKLLNLAGFMASRCKSKNMSCCRRQILYFSILQVFCIFLLKFWRFRSQAWRPRGTPKRSTTVIPRAPAIFCGSSSGWATTLRTRSTQPRRIPKLLTNGSSSPQNDESKSYSSLFDEPLETISDKKYHI